MTNPRDRFLMSLGPALEKDPGQYSQDLAMSRETGIPVEVVETDRDRVRRRLERSKIDDRRLAEQAPATVEWLSEEPETVPAVHDRLEEMGTLERVLTDVRQNWTKSWRDHEIRELQWKQYRGTIRPHEERRLYEIQQEKPDEIETGLSSPLQALKEGRYGDVPLGVPGAAAEQSTVILDQVVSRVEGAAAGGTGGYIAGAGTPASVPFALSGAVLGQNIGGFVSAYKLETPGIYASLRDIEGVTEDQARVMATLGGGISASLEFLGMGAVLRRIPGFGRALSAFTTDALREVLGKATFRNATKHLFASVATGITAEGTTEFLQELNGIAWEMAGHWWEDRDPVAAIAFDVKQPDGTRVRLEGWDAIWARSLSAAARGAQAGAGFAGAGEATSIAGDLATANRSQTRADLGRRLVEVAQKSELRKRDADTYQRHVRKVVEKGEVPGEAYVSGEALREFFSTAPEETAQELLENVPALLEQDEAVSRTGADYAIPMDQYLTYFAPSDAMAAVSEHVRYDPADMTPFEIAQMEESGELERRMVSLTERATAAQAEDDVLGVVRDHFQEQLQKVYPEGIAGVLAGFSVARVRQRAERAGRSVQDILAEEGLPAIVPPGGEGVAQALGPTLEQRMERRRVLRTVQDMREGRSRAAEKLPMRPILGAIRDLGGIDPESPVAGDLRALGVADRGRGSFPGLFRKGGRWDLGEIDFTESFDWIAERLGAEGEYGRIDPNRILEAVSEELAGRPLRSSDQEEALGQEQLEREAIERALDEVGLSLQAKDEDILDALVPVDQGRMGAEPASPETREFEQPAFHGTPHRFERFDITKIGTGEGNQAFGWGLYFSSERGIAEFYRENLASPTVAVRLAGQPFEGRDLRNPIGLSEYVDAKRGTDLRDDAERQSFMELAVDQGVAFRLARAAERWLAGEGEQTQEALDRGQRQILSIAREDTMSEVEEREASIEQEGGDEVSRLFLEYAEKVDARMRELDDGDVQVTMEGVGQVFEAEIPDDENLLDWDAPLSEQHPEVQEKLQTFIEAWLSRETDESLPPEQRTMASFANSIREGSITGEQIYRSIGRGARDGDRRSSEALAEAGILGHKYRAGQFSGMDSSATNFVIYDDKAIQVARTFYEKDPSGEDIRGSLRVTPELTDQVIVWTEKADLSTFLHENGHLWIEQLQKDAQLEGADPSLARDLETLRRVFGLGEGEAFGPEQHERFARMVEEWLMEGRAPSLELEGAFQRFSRWLVDIYKTLRNTYFGGVELSDEVRDVLDRMVASDEEIMEARAARGLDVETFRDAGEAGMDLQEWETYRQALDEARNEQESRLTRKMLAEVRRRLRKDWKANRAAMEERVRSEMAEEPFWAARHWLQKGELLAGVRPEGFPEAAQPVKIDRDDLVRTWGKDILKELPRGRYGVWSRDGMPADMVAELFGIESGTKLVRWLADNKDLSEAQEVARRTDERMRQEYGDLETAAQLEAAAVEALSSDATIRALLIEERALARKAGTRAAPGRILREQAVRTINRTKVMDLRPDLFRRSAMKASRAVTEALAEGDAAEAQRAKQRQIFSMLLESEARKAKDRTEKHYESLGRLLNPKNATRRKLIKAGHTYWDQVAKILERIELKRVSNKRIRQRESLAEFLAQDELADEPVVHENVIPQWVRDEANRRNWRELTVEELQGVRDAVDALATLARRKIELLEGSEHRSLDDVAQQLTTAARENVNKHPPPTPPGERPPGISGAWKGATDTLLGFEAEWLKIESIVDRLDGFVPDGPWRRFLWRPLAEAREKRLRRNQEFTEKYQALVEGVSKGREREMSELKLHPELVREGRNGTDGRYSKWGLLMIALNLGNESNARKLLEGYGWNEAQVMAVLDRELDARDKAFVQDVWDLINSLWPEIEDQARKIEGVVPPKVDGRTLTIGGTQLRGQYFPVVYDLSRDRHTRKNAERDTLFTTDQNQFMRPTTGHGWEKTRTKVVRPILIDPSVIPAHLDAVLLDLTHREVLLRIDRILAREDVRDAMVETIGEQQYDQFRPWLQRIAQDRYVEKTQLRFGDRILRGLRIRATTLGLGFRATTLAMQIGGHSNGIGMLRDRLGSNWRRHYLEAVRMTGFGLNVPQMRRLRDQIFQESGFMEGRIESMDRDMRFVQREAMRAGGIPGDAVGHTRQVRGRALGLIAQVQLYTVDIPIWLAAYNGAVQDLGLEHESAVDFADQMVSQSQGAGSAMDLSALQAGAEAWKQMVLFFTYQNTVYQQLRNAGVRLRERGELAHAGATAILWLTIPFVFSQLVRTALTPGRSYLPEDEDDIPLWLLVGTIGEGIGTVPLAREAGPALTALMGHGRYFASRTPYQRFVEDFQDMAAPRDAVEWTADLIYFTAGWAAGLPVADITRKVEAWVEDG